MASISSQNKLEIFKKIGIQNHCPTPMSIPTMNNHKQPKQYSANKLVEKILKYKGCVYNNLVYENLWISIIPTWNASESHLGGKPPQPQFVLIPLGDAKFCCVADLDGLERCDFHLEFFIRWRGIETTPAYGLKLNVDEHSNSILIKYADVPTIIEKVSNASQYSFCVTSVSSNPGIKASASNALFSSEKTMNNASFMKMEICSTIQLRQRLLYPQLKCDGEGDTVCDGPDGGHHFDLEQVTREYSRPAPSAPPSLMCFEEMSSSKVENSHLTAARIVEGSKSNQTYFPTTEFICGKTLSIIHVYFLTL